ncbi:TIR domain-containing protein [Flavobacterium sp.]|uniref:TIR domain-containing protein n=2 Tax=Flavobacterium sp. TaxID=239 RepID=UPI0040341204
MAVTRKVFYSFHYANDSWRVSQVRHIGHIEDNPAATPNKWEEVKGKGANAIQSWIDDNMTGRTCLVVLIGSATAGRKWINYEIKKAWDEGKGVVGINIHRLKNSQGLQAVQGANPFANFTVEKIGLNKIVKCYNPPYTDSKLAYDYIKQNIEGWIEEAITIRKNY